MRTNVQISFVPDGPMTRVHVVVFDLELSHSTTPIYQIAYDSAIPLPSHPVEVPHYLERCANQLRAKIALDRQEQAPPPRDGAQRFLS